MQDKNKLKSVYTAENPLTVIQWLESLQNQINNIQVPDLQTRVAALESSMSTVQSQITSITEEILDIQNKEVILSEANGVLTIQKGVN